MKTILVPSDFSKCAHNALLYALELAKRSNASVRLLNVVFPNQGVDNNVYEAFWIDDYLAQKKKILEENARKVARMPAYKDVPISAEVVLGFPVPELASYAENIHADLIVMGTTGATGLKGIFLGSTAGGMLSRTKIPVLTIPAKARFKAGGNIVFATDYRLDCDEKSLDVLRDFVQLHDGFVKMLHVLNKPNEEADAAREQTMSQKFGNMPHDFHYLHNPSILQAVDDFIEATDANALITISHEHNLLHKLFFDSVSRKLAHRVRVPMLALHG